MASVLLFYDNGVPKGLYWKVCCKLGKHKTKKKIGKKKTHTYFCQVCRKPRKHPHLKLVDGGNKMGGNDFKF